ncbi:MAG TPA: AraC family transcriptional regulator [Polyangiaceae bacterium]|nr:AraC family transcriptional regulator [Polyangiaceae bacterium]
MRAEPGRNRWTAFHGGVALECSGGVKLWKLVHLHYTLCVLHRGRADWKYRQSHFSVEPGAIYVCEPGEAHETSRVYCPGDFTVLFLDPSEIRAVADELGIRGEPHFPLEGIESPESLSAFSRFRAQLADSSPAQLEQALAGLTSQLLLSANPSAQSLRASESALVRARRLLEDQFLADPTQRLCVRSLARDVGVPYHSLVHGFSKYYAIAPYEFVSSMRAQYTLSELRRGPSSECSTLTGVAHKWGYADSAHMTRALRRHFAATPGTLAQQLNPSWTRSRRS